MISFVRLKHDGFFRQKPEQNWKQITGEEYLTMENIGFVWVGKVPLFSAIDQYINGHGNLKVKLFSLIKIIDKKGERINQGELLRWLGEAPWYPTALLPSARLRFIPQNNNSVTAMLTDKDIVVEGKFFINKEGQITRFKAKRYKDTNLEPWTGYYRDYVDVAGMRIPRSIEVE